jgi:hypothetical protein
MPVLTPAQREKIVALEADTAEEDVGMPASRFLITSTMPGEPEPADIAIAPHSLVGKLLFSKGGQDSYCTAQLVGDNNSMIITAAHCVRDENDGKFYTKFSFIPGFEDGTQRFAGVTCVGTWSAFPHATLPNYALDYAFGRLDVAMNAHLGLKSRLPASEWISVGYPEDVDGGRKQQFVRGGKRSVISNIVEMTENLMNGGASGGGFLADLPGNGPTVLSVNSFRCGRYMYGPYFDRSVQLLYDEVSNSCSTTP